MFLLNSILRLSTDIFLVLMQATLVATKMRVLLRFLLLSKVLRILIGSRYKIALTMFSISCPLFMLLLNRFYNYAILFICLLFCKLVFFNYNVSHVSGSRFTVVGKRVSLNGD
jgi:hypothetical protein